MGMGSYSLFAWRDAQDLASLLEETYDARAVRDRFEATPVATMQKSDLALRNDIYELIAATRSRRPAILKRIEKSSPGTHSAETALVLAVIAQVDAMDAIFRLRPGGPNRDTCASCYALSTRGSRVPSEYEFPMRVFDSYGSQVDFWGDND